MAKVKAPFFSLGASGQFGKALVNFTWKGIDVVREYVIPANPQSADQTTQRGYFTDAVSAWRNYFTNALMRTAWNRSATAEGRKESGFNNFMRAAVKIQPTDPDASFASTGVAAAGNIVTFVMLNLDDGAVGDEAGDFDIWAGDRPDSLLLNSSEAIAAGEIDSQDLGDLDDVKYVQLRKGGYNRSGIIKVTLIA